MQTEAAIRSLITRSNLLSGDLRDRLLAALPDLDARQRGELLHKLQGEDAAIGNMASTAIRSAITRKDEAFFVDLDVFLRRANASLRKAEEGAEKGSEQDTLTHFFD